MARLALLGSVVLKVALWAGLRALPTSSPSKELVFFIPPTRDAIRIPSVSTPITSQIAPLTHLCFFVLVGPPLALLRASLSLLRPKVPRIRQPGALFTRGVTLPSAAITARVTLLAVPSLLVRIEPEWTARKASLLFLPSKEHNFWGLPSTFLAFEFSWPLAPITRVITLQTGPRVIIWIVAVWASFSASVVRPPIILLLVVEKALITLEIPLS